jgi:hypothetical protein
MFHCSIDQFDMKESLDQLPIYRSYRISVLDDGMNCEACRRWNHPATWQVTLEGVPYDSTAYWRGEMKVLVTLCVFVPCPTRNDQ